MNLEETKHTYNGKAMNQGLRSFPTRVLYLHSNITRYLTSILTILVSRLILSARALLSVMFSLTA